LTKQKAHSIGFTLIELLVILSIAGTVMALAGPSIVNTVEKAQAQSEVIRLESRLKVISARAFAGENSTSVLFKGNRMRVKPTKTNQTVYSFKYLTFPEQTVVYGSIGLPNKHELIVNRAGIEIYLGLTNE